MPSGSAIAAVLRRQYHVYGDERYARLSQISVSHLYNLRANTAYKNQRTHLSKTNPTQFAIGQRKAPQPDGCAGHVRVDSVHQGDEDKVQRVYPITLVDSVTQVVGGELCTRHQRSVFAGTV